MEINFPGLRDAQELQQLLQRHFGLGKATVKDVQKFLREQKLESGEEITQGDKIFSSLIKTRSYSHQSTTQFDSCIGCKITVKPNRLISWNIGALFHSLFHSRLVKWHYMVRFYFDRGMLLDITTEKVGTGF